MIKETLNEYIISLEETEAKIARFDKRIEELAAQTRYVEPVKQLRCFLGIETHTALSLVAETGDFKRFAKGNIYAAYLGLAPGEHSSSDNQNRLGITKAGNSHLRKLLIEAAGGICKGVIGHKSKVLRARQNGNKPEVIAYADFANVRLRSRYYRFIRHGKKRNVAVLNILEKVGIEMKLAGKQLGFYLNKSPFISWNGKFDANDAVLNFKKQKQKMKLWNERRRLCGVKLILKIP